ncbi:MAG: DUF1801 domain-containing protein [Anaerolineae bacterium]|jgi:hypothetical protein
MAKAKTVAEYAAGLGDWRAEAVLALRDLVRRAAPEAKESIKWAQPVYEVNGPFCYIRAFKNHVNFGFWRGVDLPDEAGILAGSGEKMRHVKLTGLEDIREDVLENLVGEAVALNRAKGDPTKGS